MMRAPVARFGATAWLLVGLAGCSDPGGPAPGAVSEGEAQALEEAAEMLDQQRLPDGVVPVLEPAPTQDRAGDPDVEPADDAPAPD
ncbi:hypothetical protein ACI5KX_00775 [Erythrobacter sp. GH1-10]|uniref:hypothetical protein n=1 Tax=Erythrobacter sp. GH1-10 TaxID=3349334 RepID=UPI003877AB3B